MSIRLRAILAWIAAIAVGLGGYLEFRRREERRRAWPYEILKAAEDGDAVRVRQVIDEGADVNSITNGRYPWTPLMNAAFRGRTDVARLLLERGADPDREDLDFYRAITLAAAEGHWDIVRLLIEHGADTSRSDGQSSTALDYARAQGRTEMVRYLEAKSKEN